MTRTGRLTRILLMIGVLGSLIGVVHAANLGFNTTDSMPIGFYHIEPVTRPIRIGDTVEVCPPRDAERLALARHYILRGGPCPSGSIYMLKMVAAVSGDTVDARRDTIVVNGTALPHSATHDVDSDGKPLPHVARRIYRLGPGELWLWTPNPRSWDSRYYGVVPTRNVAGFERLLFAVVPWPF